MNLTRRQLLKAGALGLAAPVAGAALTTEQAQELPESFKELRPLGDRVRPITTEEFQQRVTQAQRLMRESKPRFAAVYLAPGSSLYYYAGIRWSGGERLFSLVIPATGEPLVVCPAFEEGRARELLRWPMEVRVWQEDESPYAVVARWLAERGVRTGRIGVEETMRFQFFDGLRKAAASLNYASADPITAGCRMRKTEHELELMRLANHATVDVYRAVFAALREGLTEREVRNLISQGFQKMGLSGGALVLFGQWAALPHGTTKPQKLQEGEGVLIDGGTSVEGYASDVTRCTVLGKPSEKLQRAFETVRRAQDAALEAARTGRTCGSVDDAARQVVVGAGYGKGYELFTHRLGHGIGLDGHEHPYLVRGNKIVLQPGMTFSNEPGIYVKGEYGLRLEDIMAIRADGPAELLTPSFSPSLENPCAKQQ
ncbi:MAG TPA: Xaa-Pro peptidase family protein [Candidatus Acidoferrales bacterium]|nr:Xaa-Pro peptidase family protein [Candidatus Acidoferrales bacterium]